MLFRDLPIRWKLMLVTMLTSGIVLLLACATIFVFARASLRQKAIKTISTQAEIIAANSTAPLAFSNQNDAGEVLSALATDKDFVAAALYDTQGQLFARYPTSIPDDALPGSPGQGGVEYRQSNLILFKPIFQNGKQLGSLFLKTDLRGTQDDLRFFGTLLALVLSGGFLVALVLCSNLQRYISQPILALLESTKRIAGSKDYTIRAAKIGNDEVGLLTDGLNEMLEEIQNRDSSLRENAERLRRFAVIVESSEDAIISRDTEGVITSWNRGAEKVFGYRSVEAIGNSILMLTPPERLEEEKANLARIGNGGKMDHSEIVRKRKDGTLVFISAAISPLKDPNGTVMGASEICRDITERKRADDEIRRLNEELEERVRNRTAELENANKELEAFSYSVSHDLRAPLRHIDGYVELLAAKAGTTLNEKCRRYLGTIADSARQMGQLIDDLLVFSRMGRTALKQESVNLKELVKEAIAKLERETQNRNVVWRVSQLPEVRGDEAMLRQVFVNLIGNALKYSRPRDPAEIEIGYVNAAAEESVFFVRDNGVGFDMDYADKLFGVFQRLHAIEDFEGTGIGLANVRRIIARHGGRTWAEGKVDAGATFYFSMPKSAKG